MLGFGEDRHRERCSERDGRARGPFFMRGHRERKPGSGHGDGPSGGPRGGHGGPRDGFGRGFGPGFGPGLGRGPGGRGPGGRGPGGRGRPLEQGDLRWLALDLIAAEPRHGYDIIKAIEDAFGGHYSPSPGVIYPTLTLLEETGFVAGETQGAKKLYSLTDAGREEMNAHPDEVEAVRRRLDAARARFGDAPAPEIMRATHNLRAALQVRLGKGEVSKEAIQTITAALDRAAGEIERS